MERHGKETPENKEHTIANYKYSYITVRLLFVFTKDAIYSQIYRDSFRPEHSCLKF